MAGSLGVYADALELYADRQKGLTTTHQGGEAYVVDALTRLRRFLILGSESNTFYQNARELTAENIGAVTDMLRAEPILAINTIVEISESGRAPKNDPALLALAIAASFSEDVGAEKAEAIRRYALAQLPRVARIGTHKFLFAEYVNALRGWGTALRRAFADLYRGSDTKALAYDVTKYVQRNGWSHRDLLRLSHPVPPTAEHDAIYQYITKGVLTYRPDDEIPALDYLAAVEEVKQTDDVGRVIDLINTYRLPREVLPTQWLNEASIWEALLFSGMPMHAMLRNLGNMSKVGLLVPFSQAANYIAGRLGDTRAIQKSRLHPIDVIKAKFVYESGSGMRGSGTWTPVQRVTSALESAFYTSFSTVEPSGKDILLALDVSGSMTMGDVAGVRGFTPRLASAVMAMVTARVEPSYEILGFAHNLVDLGISSHDSLNEVLRKISSLPFGGTDCALPMQYAIKKRQKVDAFVIYTDSETGGYNPSSALRKYRKYSGVVDAKLVVVGLVANRFSIADPTDSNMLDVVGFDSAAPQIIGDFIAGRI